MGVFTYADESTSVIPPPRLFKALVLEADTLIPKIAPQAVKSAEIVEGDGSVGTIKKISFGEGLFTFHHSLSLYTNLTWFSS